MSNSVLQEFKFGKHQTYNGMKRWLFNSVLVALVVILMACCGKESSAPEAPEEDLGIELISDTVSPVAGKLSVSMILHGLSNVKYLTISKVNSAGEQSVNYYPRVLSKNYTYNYTMLPTDEESFRFSFVLTGVDGSQSNQVSVFVDNSYSGDGPKYRTLTISGLKVVSRVTGRENNGHDGLPAVAYEVGNNTDVKFNVGGTDLGIVWEISEGRYGMFFGDTFGADFTPNFTSPGPNGGSWRSNVLLFSDDTHLEDGLKISGAATDESGRARQICYSAHVTNGSGDYTSIPTAAVHANGREYVHYFNMRDWNGWITNFSGMYRSTDGGGTWDQVAGIRWGSDSFFGQGGFCNIGDGFVYMIGTQTGRSSKPKLARVAEASIEDQSEYEFWTGTTWKKGDESAAVTLIDDIAGELSVEFLPEFNKWVILYFNAPRYEITFRYADAITGPWSDPLTVATGTDYPQLYGSFIHPLSKNEGGKLYFIMSMWLPYNTYLMSLDIKGWR